MRFVQGDLDTPQDKDAQGALRVVKTGPNAGQPNPQYFVAGAVPTDTFATLGELMSTWNRPDAMEFGQIMAEHIVPHYRLLFESYDKAQNVQKVGHETKLDRQTARAAK